MATCSLITRADRRSLVMSASSLRLALSSVRRAVVGMLHVDATPGSPLYTNVPTAATISRAVAEARLFHAAGLDAVILENMFDLPYTLPENLDPACVATMAVVAAEVRRSLPPNFPIGIQILAAANQQAIAVAKVVGLDFIRAEGFVFGHVADEGWVDACAGPLLRYRRMLGADGVAMWVDVKKKHSAHAVTADVSLTETVAAAKFCGADAVILTGTATGQPVRREDIQEVAESRVGLPVVLGSGVTAENVEEVWEEANAFIIGSDFKRDGCWWKEVDEERVEHCMAVVKKLREKSQ